MKILQVKSSLFSGNGQSSRLADEFVALLGEQHPAAEIVERDLAADTGAAPRRRSRRGLVREARRAHGGAARDRRRVRRAHRRAAPRGRAGARAADVQLRRAFAAQGLVRPHRARRRDFQVHRQGVGRPRSRERRRTCSRRAAGSTATTIRRRSSCASSSSFIGIADIEFVYAEGLAIGAESRNKSIAAARGEARRLALQTRLAA